MNIVSDVRQARRGPVTSPEAGTRVGIFEFPAEHPIFSGHFPEYPLVPGVYLLQSLWLVLCLGTQSTPVLKSVRTTRFQAQVRPPCTYQAVVKIQTDRQITLVRGEVICAGQKAAEALFELAAPTL